MTLQKYPKMKDSGIEWIGEIPKHWTVKKLQYVVNGIVSGPFGSDLKKESYVSNGYKIYGQEQVISGDLTFGDYYISKEKFEQMRRFRVQSDDILISCVGTFGKIVLIPEKIQEGIINPRLIKISPIQTEVVPKFLYIYLKSNIVFSQLDKLSRGGTMDIINSTILSGIFIFLPSINEQKHIVEYLDEKTKKLDHEVSKNKKLIKLLEEKRKSVINHAVTKGLDPTVKMKDSGIEWIGEIPDQWNLNRVKFITKIFYGDSLPDEKRIIGEVPVYGSNGIVGCHNESITNSETIIIGRKGSVGELNFSDKSCFPIDTTYYVDKNSTSHNLRWLFYVLKCLGLTELNKDSAVPGISREEIYNLVIPFLPNEETQIVNYLDVKTKKIDSLISKIKLQIQKLQEFRQSSISSAVTGKICLTN